MGFPGGSLGREGGRGGGGGGVGLTDEGVAGRTGEEEPAKQRSNTSPLLNRVLTLIHKHTEGSSHIIVSL